ncbi:hypothetical protein OC834_001969 [Tilletia horrida]|nr:hypothetical protein OC834_001969 [Tilletia horrida]KAK0558554.1 hypothetical protein OC844_005062 [Tilletia horrida]
MLAKTVFTLLASALAVSASPLIQERVPTIQCGDVLVSSSLTQTGPTGNERPAAFQNSKDAKGRRQLSTSVNGVAASKKEIFEFVQCNSTVLPDGTKFFGNAYIQTYGQVRLQSDPTQCLTATNLNNAKTPAAVVKAKCQRIDDSGLATQWWSATYSAPNSAYIPFYLHLVGNSQTGVETGYYTFKNVAKGDARLVETLFVPPSKPTQTAQPGEQLPLYNIPKEDFTLSLLLQA